MNFVIGKKKQRAILAYRGHGPLGHRKFAYVEAIIQIVTGIFPSVHNMLPSIFDLGQHITNFGSKIFNNDREASLYLF